MQNRIISLRFFAVLCALSLLLASRATAQSVATGTIRGTVTDQSGAALPQVQITMTNTLKQVSWDTKTDDTGTYTMLYLPPGLYSVTFGKAGFQTLVRSGIDLSANQVVQVDGELAVGIQTQMMTVKGAAPLLETQTSQRATHIDNATMENLPLSGWSEWNLDVLLPGVTTTTARAVGRDPNNYVYGGTSAYGFNGTRNFWFSYTQDGGTLVSEGGGNPAFPIAPPIDSVEEYNINTSSFGAQNGGGVAVINMVTKSGTNQFHGSAGYFNLNEALMARNFFVSKRPVSRWNQWSMGIGGPIRRDKAFFFFSYLGINAIIPGATYFTVPRPSELSGDFSAPGLPQIFDPATTTVVNGQVIRQPFPGNIIPPRRIDPVAAAVAKYWPGPQFPGLVNNSFSTSGNGIRTKHFNGKVDYYPSPKHRITGTYLYQENDQPQPVVIPGPACYQFCGKLQQKGPAATLAETWTVRPNFLNDLRFSIVHHTVPWADPTQGLGIPSKVGLKNVPGDVFPIMQIGGAIPTEIGRNLVDFKDADHASTYSDTINWIKGRHQISYGIELGKWALNGVNNPTDAGTYAFSGLFTRNSAVPGSGIGLADFLLGLPETYSFFIGLDDGQRKWYLHQFIQDDFKLRPNLTLNVGLRYQMESGWSEVFNRSSNLDPHLINPGSNTPGALVFADQGAFHALQNTKFDLLAPRLGFSWSPFKNWAIRSGYGIFFVPMLGGPYSNSFFSPPGYDIRASQVVTDQVTPIFTLTQGPAPPIYPSPTRRTATALNGQSVNYYYPRNPQPYVQEYQLGVQHELKGNILVDVAYVGSKGTHLGWGWFRDMNQVPRNLLGPGNAQSRRPFPQYQAVQHTWLNDADSIYHSLQLAATKKFSNGLSFMTNYTWSKTIDNASCDMDFAAGCQYQIAAEPSSNRGISLLDVPQRWIAAFVYELPVGLGKHFLDQGGVVNAILGGWRTSATTDLESGVPFTVTVGTANLTNSLAGDWYADRVRNGNLPSGQRSLQQWFDTSAFVVPAPFTFGNSGRNILRGPHFRNANFTLSKGFRLRERGRLEIRADFLNIFNHPNFGLPNSALGSSAFGIITSAFTPRQIQLGARVEF